MQNLTATIDHELVSVDQYANQNFGLTAGPDFPQFASALLESKACMGRIKVVTMIGMLGALSLPKFSTPGEPMTDAQATEFFSKSALREPLATLFYAGYRVGKARAEQELLEKMTGS